MYYPVCTDRSQVQSIVRRWLAYKKYRYHPLVLLVLISKYISVWLDQFVPRLNWNGEKYQSINFMDYNRTIRSQSIITQPADIQKCIFGNCITDWKRYPNEIYMWEILAFKLSSRPFRCGLFHRAKYASYNMKKYLKETHVPTLKRTRIQIYLNQIENLLIVHVNNIFCWSIQVENCKENNYSLCVYFGDVDYVFH
eukprot:190542_1